MSTGGIYDPGSLSHQEGSLSYGKGESPAEKHVVKGIGFGTKQIWAQIPILPLRSWTSAKLRGLVIISFLVHKGRITTLTWGVHRRTGGLMCGACGTAPTHDGDPAKSSRPLPGVPFLLTHSKSHFSIRLQVKSQLLSTEFSVFPELCVFPEFPPVAVFRVLLKL